MKLRALCLALPLALGILATIGCEHLALTPEGDPARVLTGTVTFGARIDLPQNAVLTVRLLDTTKIEAPMVVGEQTITNFAEPPVPFRIEYRADDALLRRGLNLEARISVGGKLRFYTEDQRVVTLSNATVVQELRLASFGARD